MEVWNREQLYVDAWEQPLVKLAIKYGVSAVMLGKVCKKLKIPVPGRGYWAKLEFGKSVDRLPLPVATDLPIMERFKIPTSQTAHVNPILPSPEPSDPEYILIKQVESRPLVLNPHAKRHKWIIAAETALRDARPDDKGIMHSGWGSLDVHVSQACLNRALLIMNAVITALEAESLPVAVTREKHGTAVRVFGHDVAFAIVEKYHEKSRRQAPESSFQRFIIEYEPTGILEFQVVRQHYDCTRLRDQKKRKLEAMLPQILGALMREGRDRVVQAQISKQQEIERLKKATEREELRKQIEAEERKVTELSEWVTAWQEAHQLRAFITALEELWSRQDVDLSPGSDAGRQIAWMKEQADRLDPLRDSPPSILDRKGELSRHF